MVSFLRLQGLGGARRPSRSRCPGARPSPAARALAAGALLAVATGCARGQGEEVPFITTPDQVTRAMLDLAQVKAGDRLIDLGSGDGRIVIEAARRGATGLGVEIVPELVARSLSHARRVGVADRVDFREQDLFQTPLAGATVVTMYLLPELNLKLRPRLLALPAGTRIVSHDWNMGDWAPDRSLTLPVPDKAIGRDKASTVHLWVVPARVQGRWCAGGAQLDIVQRFQRYSAVLTVPGLDAPALVQDGGLDVADGRTLRPSEAGLPGLAALTLRAEDDDTLRVVASTVLAPGAPAPDLRLRRAGPAGCTG